MAKGKAPENMSADDIEAELQSLSVQKDEIRDRQRALTAALDSKRGQEDAERRVAALSDPEKAALAQVLKAEGVKPRSAVGDTSTRKG